MKLLGNRSAVNSRESGTCSHMLNHAKKSCGADGAAMGGVAGIGHPAKHQRRKSAVVQTPMLQKSESFPEGRSRLTPRWRVRPEGLKSPVN